jgi:cell division protein FtsI/penicillin-binding protein 2
VIPKEGPVVQGVLGIERSLDKVLRGQDGSERVLMDVQSQRHRFACGSRGARPERSSRFRSTQRMQYVAERELKAGVIAKHARSGTAIVMNPYTGEILALANYPTYDPNESPKQGDDPISRWDLGASVPFEPGSMFKVITLTAALETTNLTARFDDCHGQRHSGAAGPRDPRIAWRPGHHQHGRRVWRSLPISARS